MVTWNGIYQKYGVVQRRVDSVITENINLLTETGRTIYDYGAGTGRNALFLANEGFDVIAFDPSSSSRELLSRSLDGELEDKIHISRLPLNGYSPVDISLAINSIHHGTYNEIMKGVDNLILPVRKEGIILFKGISCNDPKSQFGTEIEQRTRINIPHWKDGSVPHHFFTQSELEELFSKLNILSIEEKVEPVEFFEDVPHTYFELIARKE